MIDDGRRVSYPSEKLDRGSAYMDLETVYVDEQWIILEGTYGEYIDLLDRVRVQVHHCNPRNGAASWGIVLVLESVRESSRMILNRSNQALAHVSKLETSLKVCSHLEFANSWFLTVTPSTCFEAFRRVDLPAAKFFSLQCRHLSQTSKSKSLGGEALGGEVIVALVADVEEARWGSTPLHCSCALRFISFPHDLRRMNLKLFNCSEFVGGGLCDAGSVGAFFGGVFLCSKLLGVSLLVGGWVYGIFGESGEHHVCCDWNCCA